MFLRFLPQIALPVSAIIMAAAGCATTGTQGNTHVREAHPREISARVQNAGWPDRDLRSASDLYALKCGRCHKFYDPAEYSPDDWTMWFEKMSRKTKLPPAQHDILARYLAAARSR